MVDTPRLAPQDYSGKKLKDPWENYGITFQDLAGNPEQTSNSVSYWYVNEMQIYVFWLTVWNGHSLDYLLFR